MHYWDTSTLAKLYVAESDSPQFSAHLSQTGVITTSALTSWELFCVLARKEADGLISSGAAEIIFEEFLADVGGGVVFLVPMDGAEEDRFRNLVLRLYRSKPPLFTRTLDGIHLATADLHGATEFVCTDLNLRKCAAAIGLAVYP
jgi:predicted nucleic acid-binding protein